MVDANVLTFVLHICSLALDSSPPLQDIFQPPSPSPRLCFIRLSQAVVRGRPLGPETFERTNSSVSFTSFCSFMKVSKGARKTTKREKRSNEPSVDRMGRGSMKHRPKYFVSPVPSGSLSVDTSNTHILQSRPVHRRIPSVPPAHRLTAPHVRRNLPSLACTATTSTQTLLPNSTRGSQIRN